VVAHRSAVVVAAVVGSCLSTNWWPVVAEEARLEGAGALLGFC
jgi:hypothetical protein